VQTPSRSDLHVHSKYSDRPAEWLLWRAGSPECFVEPMDVYRRAKQRGMDFVTISDHNSIRGAIEIADLPGVFLSAEVTTYFPEDGCKIHVLVSGIDEEQFRMIQELRASIYDLHPYLVDEGVIATVNHPLFRVNDRLSTDHIEKLLLMFARFELVNGTRNERPAELLRAILDSLTPEMMEAMADRHGMAPTGCEPWRKWATGGSDDHSGVHIAAAYTQTPHVATVEEFLAHLRHGRHGAGIVVDPDEPGSLARAMALLVEDPDLHHRCRQAALCTAGESSWDAIWGQMWETMRIEPDAAEAPERGRRQAESARELIVMDVA